MRTSVGIQPYQTILVARTWPTADGAQMAIYADGSLGAAEEADWIARLRKGCEIAVRSTAVTPTGPRDAYPAVNPAAPSAPVPAPAGRQPRG
jgi:hypothetical protein